MVDVGSARRLFPALARQAYLNTAAVSLGSSRLHDAYRVFMDRWTADGLDYVAAEAAAERARGLFAGLIGAAARDVALVASVSAAAGLVAAQFLAAGPGENLVIGAQEYSSNHFPWRQLERRGYEIRQVPFRDGGMEADRVQALVDGGTRLVAVSAIQTASGHRSDLRALAALARPAGAWLFVDASQAAGAVDLSGDIAHVDFLATSDHKFLLNAARGMGYLYIRPELQAQLLPLSAGWRAGAVPFASFFGPDMELSPTASRFDQSISWLAAIGDEICLELLHEIGPVAIETQVMSLAATLRAGLTARGTPALAMHPARESHIVAVPLAGRDPARVLATLKEDGVVCAARDGNLRIAPHFYNDETDIRRALAALDLALR
jgi:selenocysteine lyase/cysteine desulfurase